MDNAYPLSTFMVVWSFEPHKNPFHPEKPDEEILDPEVPYLNAIGVLMYLARCTIPDIAFAVNLLVHFNSEPIMRH